MRTSVYHRTSFRLGPSFSTTPAPTHQLAAEKSSRPSLIGQSKTELFASLSALNIPPAAAQQVWQGIYQQGATSFSDLRSLSKRNQGLLQAHFAPLDDNTMVASDRVSVDGTRKWLLRFDPKTTVETVYIPELDPTTSHRGVRGSACLSSQCGCSLACSFCATGAQKRVRNLTSREIVSQLLVARRRLGDAGRFINGDAPRQVSNVVMMGQGEPLYNYKNVKKALQIIMDADGIGISRRRITLSTSGVVPFIKSVGQDLSVGLAISLHAVTDELRDEIVPANKQWPLKELLAACKAYPRRSGTRRIQFEYILIAGINDSLAEARELVRLLDGMAAYVNLIPFNPWRGAPPSYQRPSDARIAAFQAEVEAGGVSVALRTTRGDDIDAACGQLNSSLATEGASAAEKLPDLVRAHRKFSTHCW